MRQSLIASLARAVNGCQRLGTSVSRLARYTRWIGLRRGSRSASRSKPAKTVSNVSVRLTTCTPLPQPVDNLSPRSPGWFGPAPGRSWFRAPDDWKLDPHLLVRLFRVYDSQFFPFAFRLQINP